MVYANSKAKYTGARGVTLYIVRVAFMAALLTVMKLALSFIPNIEVITLVVCVYGSAMGAAYALPAVLVFCTVEMAIYGVGSWVLLYYVYWTLLALTASLLLKGRRVWLATFIGIVGSVLFGVLSACCDTLFCVASLAPARLGEYWIAYYIKGLYFDIVHVVSNAVLIPLMYTPLVAVLRRCVPTVYGRVRVPKCMRPYVMDEYVRTTQSQTDEV